MRQRKKRTAIPAAIDQEPRRRRHYGPGSCRKARLHTTGYQQAVCFMMTPPKRARPQLCAEPGVDQKTGGFSGSRARPRLRALTGSAAFPLTAARRSDHETNASPASPPPD